MGFGGGGFAVEGRRVPRHPAAFGAVPGGDTSDPGPGIRSAMPEPPSKHRMRRWEVKHHIRFLTFSCYRRLPLLNHDGIRSLLVEHVGRAREKHDFDLFGWVIMPEHVHLLIRPKLPEGPVGRILSTIKRPVAMTVLNRWRKLGAPVLEKIVSESGETHFWQPGGGHDRNIFSAAEFDEKLKYIHMNPVTRGLAAKSVDWAWSSARWYAGMPHALWIDADPRANRWDNEAIIRTEFHPWEHFLAARGRPLPEGSEAMRKRLGIPTLGITPPSP